MNPILTRAVMWLLWVPLYAGAKELFEPRAGAVGRQASGRRVGTNPLLWSHMNTTTVVCVDLVVVYDAAAEKGALW